MKIYRVRPDVNVFGWLSLAQGETMGSEELVFDGRERASSWRPLHARGQPGGKPAADFYKLGHGSLVLGPRAFEITRHVVERCGELLSVHRAGEEYRLLNVTRPADCLDPEGTRWKEVGGKKVHVLEYAFRVEDLPAVSVFKVSELARDRVFTVEGRFSRDLEFKPLVEGAGLRGLIFEEVWSSDIEV